MIFHLFRLARDFPPLQEDLATFLINRAVRNSILANYLYWYLTVEATVENPLDPHTVEMYKTMLARFSNSLKNVSQLLRNISEISEEFKVVKVAMPMVSLGGGRSVSFAFLHCLSGIFSSWFPFLFLRATIGVRHATGSILWSDLPVQRCPWADHFRRHFLNWTTKKRSAFCERVESHARRL